MTTDPDSIRTVVSRDLLTTYVADPVDERTTRSQVRTTVLPSRRSSAGIRAEQAPRYDRLSALGEGGIGEVALCEDQDIRRKVAVKRLRPDRRSNDLLLRFADEVRIAGQLEHPGVAPVHDVGLDEEGQPFFVMKYVQGETLEAVLDGLRRGDEAYVRRFTHADRARIFLAILDTVRYAHGKGILHRDLKPANVMVGPFGEVTVMDWGLARRMGDGADAPDGAIDADAPLHRTAAGGVLGTPLYMSPEQAAGRVDELDERSDIYSLCTMFFEMLTLRHPLGDVDGSLVEVLHRVLTTDPDPRRLVLVAIETGAPCEHVKLLARGLALDREKRFRTVDELRDQLALVLSGKVPVTCHITLTKRAGTEALAWIDRHGWIFTALFLVASLGAVGAGALVAATAVGLAFALG